MNKIFVYASSGGIGDVLMLLPGLLSLSKRPELEIEMSISYASLIEVLDCYLENDTQKISYDVVSAETTGFIGLIRYFLKLRSCRFDFAYFPNSSNTAKAFIALILINPKFLLTSLKRLFQRPRKGEHKINYFARRLGIADSVIDFQETHNNFAEKSASLSTKIKFSAQRPFAVFAPGSSALEAHKRWPVASFVDLIIGLKAKENLDIILLGGKEEENLMQQIYVSCARQKVDCALLQPASVLDSISVISSARYLVSGCCSAIHMGSLTNVKILGLYGPTDSNYTGPWNYNFDIFGAGLNCSPCYLKTPLGCGRPICMDAISAGSVLDSLH